MKKSKGQALIMGIVILSMNIGIYSNVVHGNFVDKSNSMLEHTKLQITNLSITATNSTKNLVEHLTDNNGKEFIYPRLEKLLKKAKTFKDTKSKEYLNFIKTELDAETNLMNKVNDIENSLNRTKKGIKRLEGRYLKSLKESKEFSSNRTDKILKKADELKQNIFKKKVELLENKDITSYKKEIEKLYLDYSNFLVDDIKKESDVLQYISGTQMVYKDVIHDKYGNILKKVKTAKLEKIIGIVDTLVEKKENSSSYLNSQKIQKQIALFKAFKENIQLELNSRK